MKNLSLLESRREKGNKSLDTNVLTNLIELLFDRKIILNKFILKSNFFEETIRNSLKFGKQYYYIYQRILVNKLYAILK